MIKVRIIGRNGAGKIKIKDRIASTLEGDYHPFAGIPISNHPFVK